MRGSPGSKPRQASNTGPEKRKPAASAAGFLFALAGETLPRTGRMPGMKTFTRICLAALLPAAALPLFQLTARASVDAQSRFVIAQSAHAMGTAALRGIRTLRVDAKLKAAGLSGTLTQWVDVRSQHVAEFASLPPIQSDDGYDGQTVWNRDQSGLVWSEGSDAGRSTAISNAYMSGYGLWQPNAGGAQVSYEGSKSDKGRAYDVLRVIAPGSKLPMDLWFDRSTHMLARASQATGPVVNTSTFSGYRPVRGLMIPYQIHVDNTNGNNSDTQVTAVAIDPAGAQTHLARPASSMHDFSILNGQQSTSIPFDLVENHVYVDVMLNGKGPYHMIFDTGGANIIDPAVAKEIGATGKGSVQGSGVGAQTEQFSFANVDRMQIGDAVVQNQLFSVLPVRAGFGISSGRIADGLIGWEVLARYVTTFDYGNNRVIFTMPSAASQPSGGHVVSFVFNGTQPQIPCGIDGIASECTIDTGARDTMTFYAPYVAQHPQVQPSALTAEGITGFGVGGPAFGRLGRVSTVSIGDLTLNDLVADYSSSKQGAFANPFVAANLGGNLLRRFAVTFDYPKQTMALVPNAAYAERDAYERSGLFLVRVNGKIVVVDSRPGTPAAAAGIAKGDAITSIDGKSAEGMTLDEARRYFAQPAGTSLRVGVTNKSGSARTMTITLRDYV